MLAVAKGLPWPPTCEHLTRAAAEKSTCAAIAHKHKLERRDTFRGSLTWQSLQEERVLQSSQISFGLTDLASPNQRLKYIWQSIGSPYLVVHTSFTIVWVAVCSRFKANTVLSAHSPRCCLVILGFQGKIRARRRKEMH